MERELRGGVGNVDDVRNAFISQLQGSGLINSSSEAQAMYSNWQPSVGDIVILRDMNRNEFNGSQCRSYVWDF
jgi:hypothetical protein